MFVMQGLQSLYEHTSELAAWHQLVNGIVPAFIDPDTDGPLPGRELNWKVINQYRVRMARDTGDGPLAERLETQSRG